MIKTLSQMKFTAAKARQGFSLLEILLAIAILGGSLAALSQIAYTGMDAAREARVLSMARVLAQAKMNEVLLNAAMDQTPTVVVSAQAEPFDSASTVNFVYSINVQPAQSLDGLLAVQVLVEATAGNSSTAIAKYQLTRWIIDPAVGLTIAEEEEELAKAEARGETDEE